MPADGLTPRRLATLAAVAALVLGAGALLRPDNPRVDPPTSLTEGATLRALSRRSQFRDMAEFAGEQIAAAGRYLVYLPEAARGGVVWGAGDSAVIAGEDRPVERVPIPHADTGLVPPPTTAPELQRHRWVLVAARQADGRIASGVGVSGGLVRIPCAGRERPALMVNLPLSRPLAGGGVFDLDGRLLAVVARCGEDYAALPAAEIETLLRLPESPPARVLGMELAELDSLSSRRFRAERGALVTAVALGSAAERAGLRPGDVVTELDGRDIAEPDSLRAALGAPADTGRRLGVIRGGRPRDIPLPASAPVGGVLGLELRTPTDAPEVGEVAPDSPAARAGLQAGDRIIRLDAAERPSREEVLEALGGSVSEPVYLVYRRGREDRGVFLLP